MNTKNLLLAVVFLLLACGTVFADRELDRTEILQLFQTLTSQPRKTWIPAGTIEAAHQEYRAPKITDPNEIDDQINQKVQEYLSNLNKRGLTENIPKMKLDAIPFNVRYRLSNEYTMNSAVTVIFDGDRFYWEINADSRTDSLKPGANLAGNFMTKQFDLNWNAKRIFAWDGEKYTTYSATGNHAIVDSTGNTPHVVNGPLTAGVIPWGYGFYTYENFSAAESSAVEKYIDGQTQIHLTLNNSDGSQMLFVMDPGKDYAVISYSTRYPDNSMTYKYYDNYQLISENWVPATILIERYEAVTNRLLARDLWDITSINGNVPEIGSFDVSYESDALIEHFSDITNKPVMYRYSDTVDTDLLLADRLAFAVSEGTQTQNCATAALKYVTGQLDKNVTDSQLAELVTEPNNDTSLLAMKQFAQGLGLYSRAVKTDIQTLKSLSGCEVILYIPGKKHFVVLGDIDNDYVRIIDLTKNKFYYRTDTDFFGMDWTEGVALLISNQPIAGSFNDISDTQLSNITGAAGYSCTNLLQEYDVVFCSDTGNLCGGYYEEYYERWGCETADSGSCSSSVLIRYKESPCIEDIYIPEACDITGEWTYYYMRACA
ncbi:MAG TPA: hypothetical protein ENH34_06840 [Phycisphaerales bacterium]|nr:hypothetical protein [Phycisphaerales bacterium]